MCGCGRGAGRARLLCASFRSFLLTRLVWLRVRLRLEGVLVTVGYNIAGYRDRDFSDANSTNKGLFATLRMKFDSGSFGFLGLGDRPARR